MMDSLLNSATDLTTILEAMVSGLEKISEPDILQLQIATLKPRMNTTNSKVILDMLYLILKEALKISSSLFLNYTHVPFIQWKLLNVITLGQSKMITLTEW
jgi:hypothetical protein